MSDPIALVLLTLCLLLSVILSIYLWITAAQLEHQNTLLRIRIGALEQVVNARAISVIACLPKCEARGIDPVRMN